MKKIKEEKFRVLKSGKVTGEKRTEAADGEVTVGGREGVEVGFVVQLGKVTGAERHFRRSEMGVRITERSRKGGAGV